MFLISEPSNPKAEVRADSASGGPLSTSGVEMTHKETLEALSGLLMGMFVAMMSATVVSNALPRIIADLHGTQAAYTWVVTATLLATTVSTPIWGKLADIFSKKMLVQAGLVIFVTGSSLAGLSQSTEWLIASRVIQGVGAGGLTALVQVVIAAMISPRERGRYSGYIGATFGVATVGGPLIGGVIVDTPALGWRWCFYVGVPFAIAAFVLLQKTLHLPVIRRESVKVDYWGATLLTGGVSVLLIWFTLAGHNFAWLSAQSVLMVLGGLVLVALTILVEAKVSEPVIPLDLFSNRTVALATVSSIFVGVAMYGATVFLSQYFQISRGASPTLSGLMGMPLILGLVASTTISGRLITKFGKWKRFLLIGGVLLVGGFGLMGTMSATTPYAEVAVFMALAGAGTGLLMQNLVLAVQNTLTMDRIGVGSSLVAFFRSLGGAVGVSVLGAVLGHRVNGYMTDGLASIGVQSSEGSSRSIPQLSTLPVPVRHIVERSYGDGVGDVFMAAVPFAVLALCAVIFIREVPLRKRNDPSNVDVREQEIAAVTAAPEGVAVTVTRDQDG